MISRNHLLIRERVAQACDRSKRDPASVQIMAVCKGQSVDSLLAAYDCGINLFGENRLQEAFIHMPHLEEKEIVWHFIGTLQKNKINRILKTFSLIQSIGDVESLEYIRKRIESPVSVFLEVNVGGEESKSGFSVSEVRETMDHLPSFDRIRITGLMTIPPFENDPRENRRDFRFLRELATELNEKEMPNVRIEHLSMGMSHDFEVAVEEGATIVRIGTALFGRRNG